MPRNKATKIATLHRMVMSDRMCPHGLKSKDLLEREGYEVEDRHLTSREEVDAFKTKHGLATTPQTFIDGVRIGGFDDLREYFGKPTKARDTLTYTPVIMLFSVAAFMALDNEFHNLVFEHAGNDYLTASYTRYAGKIAALRKLLSRLPKHTDLSFDEHQCLADAVRKGDLTEIKALLAEHIDRTRKAYKTASGLLQ
jgi:glutaredoxin|tara:strand:- start:879 stop:1469 length:591 start_codon:yes stop_codon:yes gene_type:complete